MGAMVFRLASRLPPTAIQSATDAAHSKTMPFNPGARTYAGAFWSAVRQHRFPVGPLPETMITRRLTRGEAQTRMPVPSSKSDGKRGVGNHASHRPDAGEVEECAVGFDVRRDGEQSRAIYVS